MARAPLTGPRSPTRRQSRAEPRQPEDEEQEAPESKRQRCDQLAVRTWSAVEARGSRIGSQDGPEGVRRGVTKESAHRLVSTGAPAHERCSATRRMP